MARLLSQALALAALAGSLVAAGPTNPTCVGNQDDQTLYKAPSGDSYEILCGTDYGGGDVSGTYTETCMSSFRRFRDPSWRSRDP